LSQKNAPILQTKCSVTCHGAFVHPLICLNPPLLFSPHMSHCSLLINDYSTYKLLQIHDLRGVLVPQVFLSCQWYKQKQTKPYGWTLPLKDILTKRMLLSSVYWNGNISTKKHEGLGIIERWHTTNYKQWIYLLFHCLTHFSTIWWCNDNRFTACGHVRLIEAF